MLRNWPLNVYILSSMRINTFTRSLLIILFYLGLLILLVVIQFPSFGPQLLKVGNLSLKAMPAQVKPGQGSSAYRYIEISADGIKFIFSDDFPLYILETNSIEHKLLPESYEVTDNGFYIRFSDGTSLSAINDLDGTTVWRLVPKTNAVSAHLHYELLKNAAQAAPGDEAALRMTIKQTAYKMIGAKLGEKPGILSVLSLRGVWKPFYVTAELEEAKPNQAGAFIAQAAMDTPAWNKLISSWRDKAWQSLSGSNFSLDNAGWKNSDTDSPDYRFDEASFIAYMAEAMRREQFDTAKALQIAVKAKHSEKISWQSVPLAGKTNIAMTAFDEAKLLELRTIENLVQTKTASLFYKSDIIHFLFDMAPYSLAREAMSMARQADFSKADPLQASSLLEAMMDTKNYLKDEENPFLKAAELVDRTIIPAIRKIDGAFFIQSDTSGRCDSMLNLKIAKTLIRLGESSDKSLYTGIGQTIIASLLNLSDPDGSIPSFININGDSYAKSQERLKASNIYKFIGDNTYYPHYISFFKTLGPGSWAWTSAQDLKIESNPEKTVISAFYPTDYIHYLVLYGVKPYVKVQLYGIDYNMDANFENYNASGYFYKRTSNVMYVKMRHKTQKEDLSLYY